MFVPYFPITFHNLRLFPSLFSHTSNAASLTSTALTILLSSMISLSLLNYL